MPKDRLARSDHLVSVSACRRGHEEASTSPEQLQVRQHLLALFRNKCELQNTELELARRKVQCLKGMWACGMHSRNYGKQLHMSVVLAGVMELDTAHVERGFDLRQVLEPVVDWIEGHMDLFSATQYCKCVKVLTSLAHVLSSYRTHCTLRYSIQALLYH